MGKEAEASMFGCTAGWYDHTQVSCLQNGQTRLFMKESPDPFDFEQRKAEGLPLPCIDREALRRKAGWNAPIQDALYIGMFQEWFWEAMDKTLDARVFIPQPVADGIEDALCPGGDFPITVPDRVVDLFRYAAMLPDCSKAAARSRHSSSTKAEMTTYDAERAWEREIEKEEKIHQIWEQIDRTDAVSAEEYHLRESRYMRAGLDLSDGVVEKDRMLMDEWYKEEQEGVEEDEAEAASAVSLTEPANWWTYLWKF